MRPGRPPGFALSLGITLAFVGLLIVLPLSALVSKASEVAPSSFFELLTSTRALSSLRLSFGAALVAAVINGVFGFITAWVLVRYRFVGRGAVDAVVDLPFALPTAVAGLALCALYVKTGPLGKILNGVVEVAFTPLGVVVALVFVGLPFVVRTVQPVLEELDVTAAEAAAVLGASRWQIFTRVIAPTLLPGWLTGVTLAFARGVGEYGSVVFIAGNMPGKTEITPLLIVTRLEAYDVKGATALAAALLLASFVLLLVANGLMRWSARRSGAA